jgi:hypothetical protein
VRDIKVVFQIWRYLIEAVRIKVVRRKVVRRKKMP